MIIKGSKNEINEKTWQRNGTRAHETKDYMKEIG
jgi:hypothetical protein